MLALVIATACGIGSSTPNTASSSGAQNCERVTLNSNGNYKTPVYGVIESFEHTDCKTGQTVVRQWASQQVGGPDAELPAGWSCDQSCAKGTSKVEFALDYGS
jgi:hypothetical protein